MAKATFVVMTNPNSAEVEDDFNHWYNDTHLHDVIAVEGFVSAQRYRVVDLPLPENPQLPKPEQRYFALYEMESDDLEGVARRLTEVVGTDSMQISPALDVDSAVAFYVEPIGDPVVRPNAAGTAG